MVEVVKVAAGAVTVVDGIDLVVCPVEALRETAEKLGHGELCLEVGDVGCRV